MSSLTIESLIDVQDIDLKKLLGLKVEIDIVEVEITFDYTPPEPGTMTDPAWEAEIEVTNITVITMFADGLPIRVNNAQEVIIKDKLNDDVLETACWEHVEKLNKGGQNEY